VSGEGACAPLRCMGLRVQADAVRQRQAESLTGSLSKKSVVHRKNMSKD
jgi:hypothetical protein